MGDIYDVRAWINLALNVIELGILAAILAVAIRHLRFSVNWLQRIYRVLLQQQHRPHSESHEGQNHSDPLAPT